MESVENEMRGQYEEVLSALENFIPWERGQCRYAQYTPPTPTRRNCRVASRRRCEHEFATSWRQFRRVVGVNTPVGSRDPLAAVL